METISSYEVLSGLISRQFRRGVRTNAFLSRAEWERAIQMGLSAQTTGAGLLLLAKRPGFSRLYFYLNDLERPLEVEFPVSTVTEIAFRPRDTLVREAADYLGSQGLSPILSRVRLSRAAGEAERDDSALRTPGVEESGTVLSFLRENFPRLTGCLPTQEELGEDLSAGNCLAAEDATGLAGLIHFSRDRRGGQIHHLAVRRDCRGQGLSRLLIGGFLHTLGGSAATVWTGADNRAALRAYAAFGFEKDGWESVVLSNQT